MGIPRRFLLQGALRDVEAVATPSSNPTVVKCTARAAVYKKHKAIFKAAEKDIRKEGKHLVDRLFKKKLHLLSEKDISKVLKKVIKGRIKNELVWDDLHRVIFCCNVGCTGGADPIEEPAEGRSMGPLPQTASLSPPLTMNDLRSDHTTPYNRHIDHVNAYLLSIALKKLNRRSAALLSFLFAYLRNSYRSMEPRHFLQIFLVLVKFTFRHVSVVHRVDPPPLGRDNQASHALHNWSSLCSGSTSPTPPEPLLHCVDGEPPPGRQHNHWTQMIRSEKNLLHVLTLHCADNINMFTVNDVAMTCEALCFFTLKENPFVPFWNDFLSHVFGVSTGRSRVENTSVHTEDSLLKKSHLSSYVRRTVQRRGHHICDVSKKQTNGRRERSPEWYVELSGRNMLSIVKYICLYGELHAEVLNPLAKKAKKIFFEMPLDTTLHECVEILSLLNSMNQLEDKTAEVRERIHLYEHQFGGTPFVTQYDVKCLVTLAQLCFDKLHFVPFLSIFLNNVHKFSGEDAARLVRLLLGSLDAHTGGEANTGGAFYTRAEAHTGGEAHTRGEAHTGEGNNHLMEASPSYPSTCLSGLLATLLPACPEITSQLGYTEMLLLCGALEKYTLPNRDIVKNVAKRICDDFKKVDLRSEHFPPAYVDYLFLITFTLYRCERYVDTNLLRLLVSIVLERKEEKLWLQKRRYHYAFYLLTLHREGNHGDASMWLQYFNSVWGNLSPPLGEETLYCLMLIYFERVKQGDYRSLLRHLGGKGGGATVAAATAAAATSSAAGGGRYASVKRSAARGAKGNTLVVVSPHDRRFICNEKQIKEELLKLFLHLWVGFSVRSGRKHLDLLIVMNAFSEEAYVRSYLFSAHVVNRINRYIALFPQKSSLTVHLCEDPVTKEPVRVNLSKLRHGYRRMGRKWEEAGMAEKLLATKTQWNIQQLDNATRSYILNDYKHKESVAVRGDAPQKGRPAKYLRNCKRGEPVVGALSAYGHQ
ncbi:hypothetical protein C922_04330 [Plasmodium inui San Antonio 1]|uniref:Uncharacterized protein n=1 Tax=Plasmodium inui San Antonio 1 TaxID=1237626 RepID=W7AIS4_9APIC|nr:hypothetical protein C922_04330 [Plasmodium inui San Antonio 1]EUD65201.1 hypothetical protein C922_04330 [Plasmodium inui San Antonio 1]